MRINDKGAEIARAELIRSTRPAEAPVTGSEPLRPASPVTRADSVQISEAGRELAARGGEGPELSPERIAEVRRRILEGAYSSTAVVGQVAQNILARGDV